MRCCGHEVRMSEDTGNDECGNFESLKSSYINNVVSACSRPHLTSWLSSGFGHVLSHLQAFVTTDTTVGYQQSRRTGVSAQLCRSFNLEDDLNTPWPCYRRACFSDIQRVSCTCWHIAWHPRYYQSTFSRRVKLWRPSDWRGIIQDEYFANGHRSVSWSFVPAGSDSFIVL